MAQEDIVTEQPWTNGLKVILGDTFFLKPVWKFGLKNYLDEILKKIHVLGKSMPFPLLIRQSFIMVAAQKSGAIFSKD